jgi:hypothetical protein
MIPTASAPGAGGVPTSINADSGAGTLSLAAWAGTVDDFAGSTLNPLGGDPAGASLSLVAGGSAAPFPGNTSYIQATINLTGSENPVISFATRGTATGFNSGIWSYSTDGATFTNIGASTASTAGTFAIASVDLSAADALDNAAAVTLRYTLDGATSAAGNNRIDNLQINASPIPEPASLGFSLVAGLAALTRRQRRI